MCPPPCGKSPLNSTACPVLNSLWALHSANTSTPTCICPLSLSLPPPKLLFHHYPLFALAETGIVRQYTRYTKILFQRLSLYSESCQMFPTVLKKVSFLSFHTQIPYIITAFKSILPPSPRSVSKQS